MVEEDRNPREDAGRRKHSIGIEIREEEEISIDLVSNGPKPEQDYKPII